MNDIKDMMLKDIATTLWYYGSCDSFDDIKDIKGNIGEVVIDKSKDTTYVYDGHEWLLLCDNNSNTDQLQTNETDIKITDMKCKNCGAPLIKYNKYSKTIKCEYCDSIFDIKEIFKNDK